MVSEISSRSRPLGIAESLRGKRIFLTGATGFLGRVLVEKLLWSAPEVGKLLFLIRADRDRSAEERLRQDVFGAELMDRLRARHGDDWDAWLATRVQAVPGDLGEDRFGLDAARYAALCGGIDLVVASAATVTFDERLDRSLALNTRGAGRTLALARDAGNVPLLHVSTCFVSGNREGTVPERVLPPPLAPAGAFDLAAALAEIDETCRALCSSHADPARPLVAAGAEYAARYGFTDVYTLTKSLGEQLLARDRGAVPITIVRPATVESAARQPMPGWIEGIKVTDPLLVAYGRGRTRDFPGAAATLLDVIPVDHVVNTLIAALAELARVAHPENHALQVYQVSSSRNPISIGKLLEYAREGFLRSPFRDEQGHPVPVEPARFVASATLRAGLVAKRGRVRLLARALRGSRWAPALGSAERTLDHFLRLIDVYTPYLRHRARHADDETRRLWSGLSAADQAEFNFDITALDWRSYIATVHVPGLQRFALHAESGAPVARLADALTRRHAEGRYASDDAETLYELFETAARLDPHGVAFQVCRGGRWLRYTYGESLTTIGNIAWRLSAQYGIARGDRVALVSGGSPEWALTTLAAYRLGAVTVPLDPQWPAGEIADAAAFTGAKLICVAPQLRAALVAAARCPVVVLAAPFVPAPHVGLLPGADVAAIPGKGSDVASIIFTSGTTVAPKAVPLSHENFLSNVRGLMPVMNSSRERMLSVLPVHHVFEAVLGLWVPISSGSTISYVTEIKPAELQWVMRATRPTMMVAVPRLLELLHNGVSQKVAAGGALLRLYFRAALAVSERTGGRYGRALFGKVHATFGGELRRIVVGGSAFDASLGKSYQRLGIKVSEGYGMTETSPVLTVNPWNAIRFGAVGKPLAGVDVELRPAEGAEPGAGEVWVRGPNVMAGYYQNPEASAAVLKEGWLCTGDIGRFDSDGYLHLCGRTKDVIVSDAGKNVYPEEVEVRYRGIPGVLDLVVLGVPGLGRGERVCAVIVPQAQATEAQIEEIRAAIAARSLGVPSYQQINLVEIWRGDLPKTTTLKVKRGKLRDAVLAGQRGDGRTVAGAAGAAPAAAAAAGAALSKDETWVLATIARLTHSRPEVIQPNQRLADLGVDSLTKVELVGEMEVRLGFRVDDAAAAGLVRVQDLLDLTHAGRPAAH